MTSDARTTFAKALGRLFVVVQPQVIEQIADRMSLIELKAGKTLYKQGEPADGMHIVHTGRLQVRMKSDDDGRERTVNVLNHGDALGEIALFTHGDRVASVVAVRDSSLGYLSRDDFDKAIASDPAALMYIARFIINRLISSFGRESPTYPSRTLCVVPLDDRVDVIGFTRRLQHALLHFGPTALLEAAFIHSRFPAGAQTEVSEDTGELGRFLEEIEDRHDFVVLAADPQATLWNERCVAYADSVVLIASATTAVEDAANRARRLLGVAGNRAVVRELVLIHDTDTTLPRNTKQWLDAIPVVRHHHLQWATSESFKRLARVFSGNMVAVVCSGGGARGFAHIGVVRALREAGVPIDAIVGTSLGAIVAAGVAMGWDDGRMLDEYKGAFVDVNPANDYTLPIFSLIRGHKMSLGLQRHFGDTLIEDLWIPFFAISSNLSNGSEYLHRRGALWRSLRASASLPAVFPPFVEGTDILVDGGILNNIPLNVARDYGAGYKIVIDVSAQDDFRLQGGRLPSIGNYLKDRLLSGGNLGEVPTIQRVVFKATVLGSRREAAAAREQADLLITPPLKGFDLLEWNRLLDICEVGYRSSCEQVADWTALHPELLQHEEFLDSCRRGLAT